MNKVLFQEISSNYFHEFYLDYYAAQRQMAAQKFQQQQQEQPSHPVGIRVRTSHFFVFF
jgi:hypothetical protein